MKNHHIILLTATATLLASCAADPTSHAAGTQIANTDQGTLAASDIKRSKLPVGRPDPQGKANMVISPFRPYNIIDVKGYRSGDIVGDPSTAKFNISTGKLDLSTSKHFLIP